MTVLNCEYSEPLVLDSSGILVTPTDETKSFQFANSICEVTGLSDEFSFLSPDNFIDNYFGPFVYVFHSFTLFIIFFGAIYLGTYLFKRNN